MSEGNTTFDKVIDWMIQQTESIGISPAIIPLVGFSIGYYLIFKVFRDKNEKEDKFYKYLSWVAILIALIGFVVTQFQMWMGLR